MSQTPESISMVPVSTRPDDGRFLMVDQDGVIIANVTFSRNAETPPAIARRLKAAYNATAKVAVEYLEAGALTELTNAAVHAAAKLEDAGQVEARNRLCEALGRIIPGLDTLLKSGSGLA